jgi:hypothetical protein
MSKQLSDLNQDGTILGQSATDRVSMYNAVPIAQRSSPMQQVIAEGPMGQVITMKTTGTLSPTTIGSHLAGEATIPVTGLLGTDFVFAVNKSNGTATAGLGIAGVRAAGDGSLGINFTNNSTGTLTPTGADPYNVVALRNMNPLSISLSPVSVAANTQVEQVFSLAPNTLAVLGTPIVNAAGQVTGIPIVSGGAGYQVPPTIVISSGTPSNDFETGTATGLGVDFNYQNLQQAAAILGAASQLQMSVSPAGYGASAIPLLTAGVLTGIKMTHVGKNYSSTYPPTATLIDGTYFSLGQTVMVNKAAQTPGLGIGNVRVVAHNQIGITYINYTAAAITPTAPETYLVMALNDIPAVSPWSEVGATLTSTSATASTTVSVTEITVTANGILALDMPGIAVKPTLTAGIATVGGRCAANQIVIQVMNPSTVAITPAGTEVYVVPVLRAAPIMPAKTYIQLFTPVSVAANTTAEQQFTVTGLIFTNSVASTVRVTKPSMTAGLEVVNARVSATSTLQVTYQNNTAAAIVPPAEYYTILNFQDVAPNALGWIADWASFGINQLFDLTNEQQQSMAMIGMNKGG